MLQRLGYRDNGHRKRRDEMEANIDSGPSHRVRPLRYRQNVERRALGRWIVILMVCPSLLGCQSGQAFRALHLDADLRQADLGFYQDRARTLRIPQPEG